MTVVWAFLAAGLLGLTTCAALPPPEEMAMATTMTAIGGDDRSAQHAQATVAAGALGASLLLGESALAGGFLLLFT